jgi:molybdenum cofactor synthesis domain-containing protein
MKSSNMIPDKIEALVITLSDRAHAGDYDDLSGPRVKDMLNSYLVSEGWDNRIDYTLLPDDPEKLRELLMMSFPIYDLIITTGGTGLGPRDTTIEVVSPLLEKSIPGVMEFIRTKYGASNPNALLSRGVAGINGKTLIYTLPGSVNAVSEYMTEILKTMKHTFSMMYAVDTHVHAKH